MQQLSLFTFRQIYTIRFFFCSHNSTGIDRQIFYPVPQIMFVLSAQCPIVSLYGQLRGCTQVYFKTW